MWKKNALIFIGGFTTFFVKLYFRYNQTFTTQNFYLQCESFDEANFCWTPHVVLVPNQLQIVQNLVPLVMHPVIAWLDYHSGEDLEIVVVYVNAIFWYIKQIVCKLSQRSCVQMCVSLCNIFLLHTSVVNILKIFEYLLMKVEPFELLLPQTNL